MPSMINVAAITTTPCPVCQTVTPPRPTLPPVRAATSPPAQAAVATVPIALPTVYTVVAGTTTPAVNILLVAGLSAGIGGAVAVGGIVAGIVAGENSMHHHKQKDTSSGFLATTTAVAPHPPPGAPPDARVLEKSSMNIRADASQASTRAREQVSEQETPRLPPIIVGLVVCMAVVSTVSFGVFYLKRSRSSRCLPIDPDDAEDSEVMSSREYTEESEAIEEFPSSNSAEEDPPRYTYSHLRRQ